MRHKERENEKNNNEGNINIASMCYGAWSSKL